MLFLLLLGSIAYGQGVSFTLVGLEDTKGVIRVAVYENANDFNKESTKLKYTFDKTDIIYGVMEIKLNLEPGKYAIAFLDDINYDAKMNFNLIGVPKEGYAFSDIKDYGYSKPSFSEAVIEVKEGGPNVFEILFNYF